MKGYMRGVSEDTVGGSDAVAVEAVEEHGEDDLWTPFGVEEVLLAGPSVFSSWKKEESSSRRAFSISVRRDPNSLNIEVHASRNVVSGSE